MTGIFLGLHYTSDINSAYSSLFFFIREIFYGWCLRYLHSSVAGFLLSRVSLLEEDVNLRFQISFPVRGCEGCEGAVDLVRVL